MERAQSKTLPLSWPLSFADDWGERDKHKYALLEPSARFQRAHTSWTTAPPLHGADIYTREEAHLVTEWWCVGGVTAVAGMQRCLQMPSISHCGPGCWGWGGCCFPACTALQPSLLLRLPEFWFDRYENNFKNHTMVYSNPELMALFCLTGKDKETTTPQWPRLKQHRACYTQTEKPCRRG